MNRHLAHLLTTDNGQQTTSLRSNVLAFCIRKFLTKVLTPLTGFIQRRDLQHNTENLSLWKKSTNHITRWLSWCSHGAITLAYPHMRYNPIKSRRQETQWKWASKLLNVSQKNLKQIATEYLIKQQDRVEIPPLPPSSQPTSFTILLCFHRHLDYFKDCLNSIHEALSRSPQTQVEILLINDDPSIDLTPLLASVDFSLREKIIFRSHLENQGICNSLNEGITHAQGEWLIYLDCDDQLDPTTFLVLERTIRKHPDIRFISSRTIDIDIDNDILFWRLRSEHPYELIKNNFASHLKVIKKELHTDLGLFKKAFEGCQDYEFALRAAINEPLLFIPNYLYRYRWHHDTQTVSQNERQNLTAMRIRQSYMLAIYWLTHGTEMIEWHLTGPEAASWEQKIASMTHNNAPSKTRYQVTLEATTPYNPLRWKLLLVELSTLIIDRYRERDNNTLIYIRLGPVRADAIFEKRFFFCSVTDTTTEEVTSNG